MMMHRILLWGVLLAGLCVPAWAGEVTALVLVDAGNERPIRALHDGDVVDLSKTNRGINVDAKVAGDVASVRFGLNGKANQRTESTVPFAAFGDAEGNFSEWIPKPGKYTITATPFSQKGAKGDAGKTVTVSFKVVGSPKRAKGGPAPQPSKYPDIKSAAEIGKIAAAVGGSAEISGELKRWHPVVLTFEGPATSETASPNPFLHYRLNVTFTQGETRIVVPGFYAGDGRGGVAGNRWRTIFAPPSEGAWSYEASFRAGFNVNTSLDPKAGQATACDGGRGEFVVRGSDRKGDDFRASVNGLLINRGDHYLTFGGSKEPWLKAGPDIPENFLGYSGFENTPNPTHSYPEHVRDWRTGDPDWGQGKGKGIIGALNYIAAEGGNCIYFLPMNIGGDGKDTFPTIGAYEKTRYDSSKLRQWEIVFRHAQSLGIFLHFQLAETENANENYHDGGTLGPERRLFYRELVARFGHHNGIQFNIGEENDYTTAERVEFACFIKAVDPYSHPVAVHTHGGKEETLYDSFIEILKNGGEVGVDMTSYQGGRSRRSMSGLMTKYRKLSRGAGSPWVMSYDEPQPIHNDAKDQQKGHPAARRAKMWPCFMGGGGGFEWYIQEDGGGHGLDQRIEDFRQIESVLNWCRYVREFLGGLPLKEMDPDDSLAESEKGLTYVLAQKGEVYALYNDTCGQGISVDLTGESGKFSVTWFDPRNGGFKSSDVTEIAGGGVRSLGKAPSAPDQDWACLMKRK